MTDTFSPLLELVRRRRPLAHPLAVCAHRGNSKHAPESTMAAFRSAIEVGADVVELDIHLTSCGELVVIHDTKLDRTTDGKGLVRKTALAAIRALDAGRHFSEQFEGERVPVLDEVLELLLPAGVVPMIEIKGRYRRVKGIEDPLGSVLRSHDAIGDVIVVVHDGRTGKAVRGTCEGVMLSRLAFLPRTARAAANDGFEGVNIHRKALSRRLLRYLHERNVFLTPWTINRRKNMEKVIGLGVDAIISDDPVLLRQVVEEHAAAERAASDDGTDSLGLSSEEDDVAAAVEEIPHEDEVSEGTSDH